MFTTKNSFLFLLTLFALSASPAYSMDEQDLLDLLLSESSAKYTIGETRSTAEEGISEKAKDKATEQLSSIGSEWSLKEIETAFNKKQYDKIAERALNNKIIARGSLYLLSQHVRALIVAKNAQFQGKTEQQKAEKSLKEIFKDKFSALDQLFNSLYAALINDANQDFLKNIWNTWSEFLNLIEKEGNNLASDLFRQNDVFAKNIRIFCLNKQDKDNIKINDYHSQVTRPSCKNQSTYIFRGDSVIKITPADQNRASSKKYDAICEIDGPTCPFIDLSKLKKDTTSKSQAKSSGGDLNDPIKELLKELFNNTKANEQVISDILRSNRHLAPFSFYVCMEKLKTMHLAMVNDPDNTTQYINDSILFRNFMKSSVLCLLSKEQLADATEADQKVQELISETNKIVTDLDKQGRRADAHKANLQLSTSAYDDILAFLKHTFNV